MNASSGHIVVQDNPSGLRYELFLDGDLIGELLYSRFHDRIALIHTEVSPSVEGRGLGARLVAGALDDIRARGLHVVPICPFVSSYISRHPDYGDLVARKAGVSG
jgi:predicted GNAT family acetyltransferase